MPETEVSGPAAPRRLQWQTAEIAEIIVETPRVKSLVLNLPDWPGHKAGQHVDVRLTAEDGYQAQRSYSIASAPEDSRVTLTVERIEDGEVSPYLTQDVQAGDKFELRGPIGGYFVWTATMEDPLFLIAGGSGIVPLMAMLRHRAAAKSETPATLIYSSRSHDDIIYRAELERMAAQDSNLKVLHTLTRRQPPGWSGLARRIDSDMLQHAGFPAESKPRAFICGPTPFVETAAGVLSDLGHARNLIKTERFGPTGG
jgi:ferredoxin-NADP reductase